MTGPRVEWLVTYQGQCPSCAWWGPVWVSEEDAQADVDRHQAEQHA